MLCNSLKRMVLLLFENANATDIPFCGLTNVLVVEVELAPYEWFHAGWNEQRAWRQCPYILSLSWLIRSFYSKGIMKMLGEELFSVYAAAKQLRFWSSSLNRFSWVVGEVEVYIPHTDTWWLQRYAIFTSRRCKLIYCWWGSVVKHAEYSAWKFW